MDSNSGNAGRSTDAVRADGQLSAPRCPSQPRDRTDFRIAIICALPLEAIAISALFDKRWDDQAYGEALRDSNAYSIGRFGTYAKYGEG